jgi:beta-glucanase (GH16 family)
MRFCYMNSRYLNLFFILIVCGCRDTLMNSSLNNSIINSAKSGFNLSQQGSASFRSVMDNSKCMDVRSASSTNSSAAQIYDCNGTDAQNVTLINSNLRVLGKCLSAAGNDTTNGTPIILWDCHDGADQRWTLVGNELQLNGTNKCIGISAMIDANSTPLVVWDCTGNKDQQWASTSVVTPINPVVPVNPIVPTAIIPGGGNSGKYKQLVWNDEFDGTGGVDASKWNVEVNCDGGGNGEWQCYTNSQQNIYKDGQGHLVIQVVKNYYGIGGFTSGRVTTANKGDWTYGRFESRIQVPAGQGFWPAFWMMPTQSLYGAWPTSGEIDIMEILGGNPNGLYSTLHFGELSPYTQAQGINWSESLATNFHIYAVERDTHQMRFYLDNNLFYTLNDTEQDFWISTPWANSAPSTGAKWPFNEKFFVILNTAMGGSWPGKPDANIQSGKMIVDYVRVFQ